MISTKELDRFRAVDIGAVTADQLPDVGGQGFDNTLSKWERIAAMYRDGKNPYCFSVGGVGVKVEFSEGGPRLQDALTDFLIRQRTGP